MAKVNVSKKDVIRKAKKKTHAKKVNSKKPAKKKVEVKNKKSNVKTNTIKVKKNIDKLVVTKEVVKLERKDYPEIPEYHTFKEDLTFIISWLKKIFKNIYTFMYRFYCLLRKKVKAKKVTKIRIENKNKRATKNVKKVEKVIEVEDDAREIKKMKWWQVVLYYFVVFALGLIIGYIPFIGIKPTKTTTVDNRDCKYSEWKETEVNYCLVNSEDEPYEGEYVKYSLDAEMGLCIKYTRKKVCE